MPKRSRGKVFARLRRGRGRVPAKRARTTCGRTLAPREKCHGFTSNDWRATVEHALRKCSQVGGGREQTGMSRDSAEYACVLILNFALDNAIAKCLVIGSGRDVLPPFSRWIESG